MVRTIPQWQTASGPIQGLWSAKAGCTTDGGVAHGASRLRRRPCTAGCCNTEQRQGQQPATNPRRRPQRPKLSPDSRNAATPAAAISVRHAAAPRGGRSSSSTRVTGNADPHTIATALQSSVSRQGRVRDRLLSTRRGEPDSPGSHRTCAPGLHSTHDIGEQNRGQDALRLTMTRPRQSVGQALGVAQGLHALGPGDAPYWWAVSPQVASPATWSVCGVAPAVTDSMTSPSMWAPSAPRMTSPAAVPA